MYTLFTEGTSKLEDHNARMISQFRCMKEVKNEIKNKNDVIGMRIGLSENSNIFQTKQDKGTYYQNFQGSFHPMVIFTKDSSYSVGTISDCTDHNAFAVWIGLEKVLSTIISEKTNRVVIISASPTCQYRNKLSTFFAQK